MKVEKINECATLNNGVRIPWLGFGTYKIERGEDTVVAVREALLMGYRLIDGAAIYGNEEGVGQGIKASGVPREDIFLTSKVWNTDQGYDETLNAFEESCRRLQTDYLDLYMVHWPKHKTKETWRAMEKLYRDGRVKAIGVCNFKIHHIETLLEEAEIKPVINQVEFHPYFVQTDLMNFCKENDIMTEAWAPLMQGKIFEVKEINEIAKKYEKTVAQIALRWDLQMGLITIPKTVQPHLIRENSQIFDFEISEEDMERITGLDRGQRLGPDPDTIDF